MKTAGWEQEQSSPSCFKIWSRAALHPYDVQPRTQWTTLDSSHATHTLASFPAMQTRLILSGTECKVYMGINMNAGDRWWTRWTKIFVFQAYMEAELAIKAAFLPAPGKVLNPALQSYPPWQITSLRNCWQHFPGRSTHLRGTVIPRTVGKFNKHKPYLPKLVDSIGPAFPDLSLPKRGLIQSSWNQHLVFLDGKIQKQLLPSE